MKRACIALSLVLLSAGAIFAQQADIAASDFDNNGRVEFQDFLIFASGFGKSAGQTGYDARLDLSQNAPQFKRK